MPTPIVLVAQDAVPPLNAEFLDGYEINSLARNHSESEDYNLWVKFHLPMTGDEIIDESNKEHVKKLMAENHGSDFYSDDDMTYYVKAYETEDDQKSHNETEACQALVEIIEGLEDYPALDDEDVSRRQYERALELMRSDKDKVDSAAPEDWPQKVYALMGELGYDDELNSGDISMEHFMDALKILGYDDPEAYYGSLTPQEQDEVDALEGKIEWNAGQFEKLKSSDPERASRQEAGHKAALESMIRERNAILRKSAPKKSPEQEMPLFERTQTQVPGDDRVEKIRQLMTALKKDRQAMTELDRRAKDIGMDQAVNELIAKLAPQIRGKDVDWDEIAGEDFDVFASSGRIRRI